MENSIDAEASLHNTRKMAVEVYENYVKNKPNDKKTSSQDLKNNFEEIIQKNLNNDNSFTKLLCVFNDIALSCDLEDISAILDIFEVPICKTFNKMSNDSQDIFNSRLGQTIKSLRRRLPYNFDPLVRARLSLLLARVAMFNDSGHKSGEKLCNKEIFDSVELSSSKDPKVKTFIELQTFLSNPNISAESVQNSLKSIRTFLENLSSKDKVSSIDENDFYSRVITFKEKLNSEIFGGFYDDINTVQIVLIQILVYIQFLQKNTSDKVYKETKHEIEHLFKETKKSCDSINVQHALLKKILKRNDNWIDWKHSKFPVIRIQPLSLSKRKTFREEQGINKVVKRDKSEYLYRAWPQNCNGQVVAMGNLVLENLWESNPDLVFEKKGQKRENKDSVHKLDFDVVENSNFITHDLLPEVKTEREKLKNLMENISGDETVPELVRFKMLRLLKEKDYTNFKRIRGQIRAIEDNV